MNSKAMDKANEMLRQCSVGAPPMSDDGYFEQMAKTIFQTGFSWTVIENKWDNFRAAFANFEVEKVAHFGEDEVNSLMEDAGIVRNFRKITACVQNAREIVLLRQEHGSMRKWLNSHANLSDEQLCKTVSKRFAHLGKASAMFFLRKVGHEVPGAVELWKVEQARKAG